jgi:hypothetical protein
VSSVVGLASALAVFHAESEWLGVNVADAMRVTVMFL